MSRPTIAHDTCSWHTAIYKPSSLYGFLLVGADNSLLGYHMWLLIWSILEGLLMSGIYIGLDIAVLVHGIASIHQLPYKLSFYIFSMCYIPLVYRFYMFKRHKFFFLKWLQIDSDLSCQIIEIPGSFFFTVTFSACIFKVLLGKKTGVIHCLFKVLSQWSCITLCFCYPGILHRSNIVVVICIWLCYFVCSPPHQT